MSSQAGIWRRVAGRAAVDTLCWAVGILVAAILRLDFQVEEIFTWGQVAIVPVAACCMLPAGALTGLYTGRFRFGSFEEVGALVRAVLMAGSVLFVVDRFARHPYLVPLSAVLGGAIIGLVLMMGARYLWRMRVEARRRPSGTHVARVLVFGAGEGGARAVSAMLTDPDSPYLPVAILDDDPAKANLRLRGVPVVGDRAAMALAANTYDASMLLMAVPSAGRALLAEVTTLAAAAYLPMKVLPSVRELGAPVRVRDIRDLAPADLLGRREINTSVEEVAAYVADRRILVTGAGGSIGSELCRQLARLGPRELVMLDRDESALLDVKLSIGGRAMLDTPDLVLADLRDRARIEAVFADRRPEVVFHAAALKHLPLLERHPWEGVRTNVAGTLDLLEVAMATGVGRFVNISTDKAADPGSVLGYTKRIGERLTAWAAASSGRTFLSVRFGNVLGSRGSMLETFTRQIAAGGPVTVTDPEVSRFFMTTGEAVQLLIQAGAIGSPGQVLVLDMGAPVRIEEVASLLIRHQGAEGRVSIVHTGLRDGEKLHEVLLGTDEIDRRPHHPLISEVPVPPLDPVALAALDLAADRASLVAALAAVACLGAPSLLA
jgi:FlaA1/EpsC-like NDP-sugar epimerase